MKEAHKAAFFRMGRRAYTKAPPKHDRGAWEESIFPAKIAQNFMRKEASMLRPTPGISSSEERYSLLRMLLKETA